MASHDMTSQPSNQSSSFIDKLLAGQLFVAARAHDSLSEEVSNFLPSSISDIFPTSADEHSRKYKTAAYSALVKSQHHQEDEDDDDSVTNEVKGNVVLHVLRDNLLSKIISSYMTMNDKLSLIFAVSDEEEAKGEEDKDEDKDSDEGSTPSPNKGISLSEDLFHRESEDLEVQRHQYLAQLVRTREVESKMQNLKQKLDRTENILNNPHSADLLRLNYMASKLFLLRDITSKNYEDYFSARGNYATWSLDHQARYTATVNQALEHARLAVDKCRTQHETTLLKCKQLMTEVISGDHSKGGGSFSGSGRHKAAVGAGGGGVKASRRRASVVVSAKEGVQLRPTEEVREFKEMRAVGLTYLAPYQDQEHKEEKEDKNEDESDKEEDNTTAKTVITQKPFSESVDEDGIIDEYDNNNLNNNAESVVSNDQQTTALANDESKAEVNMMTEDDKFTPAEVVKKEYIVDEQDLEAYRQRVSLSLKAFEVELCEHLENMSKMSLESVKKKFISFDLSDELPVYLKDIKWKIDQKRKLVVTGTNQIQATKESLAVDFESRIEKSYGFFLEQQMTKLRRVQSYCHVEGST